MRITKYTLMFGLTAAAVVHAQTVDFEPSLYAGDKTVVGIDGWTKFDPLTAIPDNFKIQSDAGNRWLHCETTGNGTIYKDFPAIAGTLDLRWRWRSVSDGAHLCLGVARKLPDGTAFDPRALACIDPYGTFEAEGGTPARTSNETWVKQTWYYMRLVLDLARNTSVLYLANDSLRTDERVAVSPMPLNDAGALTRLVLRDVGGTSAVDIDDISWTTGSTWVGGADGGSWSNPANWSAGAVPDSLTRVTLDSTSPSKIFVDKEAYAASIAATQAWQGEMDFGPSTLSLLDNADFRGTGAFAFQSGGKIAFLSPRGQSLLGPQGGTSLPPLRHEGAGTLRLDGRTLNAEAFDQTRGSLDLNGSDMNLKGGFTLKNGKLGSLLNLDGRTLKVGHGARFEGVSKDSTLGFYPADGAGGSRKGWTVSMQGGGDSVTARFAVLSNSKVTGGTGYAFQSSNGGGNNGWIFVAPPTLSASPKDVSIKVGEVASFLVTASGTGLSFQWLRDGKEISGAVDSIYSIPGARRADGGAAISCKVSNGAGVVTSASAKLNVGFPPPVISPGSRAFADSLRVTLSDSVAGAVLYVSRNHGPFQASTGFLTLTDSTVLKAFAVYNKDTSDITENRYDRVSQSPHIVDPPTVTPKGRTFSDTLRITLAQSAGAPIFYTFEPGPLAGAHVKAYANVALVLDTTATLRAFAIEKGDTSSLATESYTFVRVVPQPAPNPLPDSTPKPPPMDTTPNPLPSADHLILAPGDHIDLAGHYTLSNPGSQSGSVHVEVVPKDSFAAPSGFRDVSAAIRISSVGGAAFPRMVFASPTTESRALYRIGSNTSIKNESAIYITTKDTVVLTNPGTYFFAEDTLPPRISLLSESIVGGDSTQAVFTVQDNVANLLVDLFRSDNPDLGFTTRSLASGDTITVALKNPPDEIKPLSIRLQVKDHRTVSSFPGPSEGVTHLLAQQSSHPIKTPSVFGIGKRASDPWDLIAVPLALDPPLTPAQIRGNNAASDLKAAMWNEASGEYRYLADDEAILPGSSVWLASRKDLSSLAFPKFRSSALASGNYSITIHKGWNQIASPILATTYWPISRSRSAEYDASLLKGLHAYDAAVGDYVHSDSLEPWRGYFVYYQGSRDTVITLLPQPVSAPAAKSASAAEGLSLILRLDRTGLRLGADALASDGIGIEDEMRPPPQGEHSVKLWSAGGSRILETDLRQWRPGAIFRWRVVAGLPARGNASVTLDSAPPEKLDIAGMRLPEGYAAWAVSRSRGVRTRLVAGAELPVSPGFTDSLDVFVGPAAELEANLSAIPTAVGMFTARVSAAPSGFMLHLRLPAAARLRWSLWTLDGRFLNAETLDLPQGIYDLARSGKAHGLSRGLYTLALEWTVSNAMPGSIGALGGRQSSEIIIP